MNMNDYQTAALRTAAPKDKKDEVFHLVHGLCGESGEIAEKVKKIVRDKNGQISDEDKAEILKELGDVLWYVAVLADHFDITLGDVADKNIAKLADRQKRGLISGSGDNR